MKSQLINVFASVAVAAAMCSGGSSQAARIPRIELLREVRATGTRLLLSDLLPGTAPDSLRLSAAEISLGAAPQPGNTRALEHGFMMDRISVHPDVLSQITVPDNIVVSREVRPITVSEVLDAVRNALERSGVQVEGILGPEDILLQAQVFVSPGDARLQVMRMDFDTCLRRARFLLWPSGDPKVLPFFVTVRLKEYMPARPVRFEAEPHNFPNGSDVPSAPISRTKKEILVAPGEQATLVVQSSALRMLTDVAPLERGALGQQIRVRVLDTGKIFNARVDGRAHLEIKF